MNEKILFVEYLLLVEWIDFYLYVERPLKVMSSYFLLDQMNNYLQHLILQLIYTKIYLVFFKIFYYKNQITWDLTALIVCLTVWSSLDISTWISEEEKKLVIDLMQINLTLK